MQTLVDSKEPGTAGSGRKDQNPALVICAAVMPCRGGSAALHAVPVDIFIFAHRSRIGMAWIIIRVEMVLAWRERAGVETVVHRNR